MNNERSSGPVAGAKTVSKSIQFVMKLSKYCNLRCTYCYEFAYLNDKRRMSLDELATMFGSVSEYADEKGIDHVSFTWHGGEPLVVPLRYYQDIRELQRRMMPGLSITNGVQTNLTILTDKHLEFLRSGEFFDRISVSFDVFGDQRVDKMGRPTTQIVLENMQRLADANIAFGVICVLSRSTAAQAVDIFNFFQEIGASFRFLPFHSSTDGTGESLQSLSQREIVMALNGVFDAWVQSARPGSVRPLADLIDIVNRVVLDAPRRIYDKATDEWTYVVNPNGDLWGISELEDNRFLYGNVFMSGLSSILTADVRTVTFNDARQRIGQLCKDCRYLGHCSGYPMADIADGLRATVEREGCHRQALLDHMIARFQETGLADDIRCRSAVPAAMHGTDFCQKAVPPATEVNQVSTCPD